MERKKLIELVASIFVALIFISSYISLTNYSSSQATTTVPGTAYAQALSRAVLTGYGSPMYLNVSCSNSSIENATLGTVNSTLTELESNGSVLDFYPTKTNISIAAQAMGTYGIYSLLRARAGTAGASCMKAYATAYVSLPQQLNITVSSGQRLAIPVPSRYINESVYMSMGNPTGSVLYVKASMLVTQNGSIYGAMSIVPLSYDPFPTTVTTDRTTTATSNATAPTTSDTPSTTAGTTVAATSTAASTANAVTTAKPSGGSGTGGVA